MLLGELFVSDFLHSVNHVILFIYIIIFDINIFHKHLLRVNKKHRKKGTLTFFDTSFLEAGEKT